MVDLTYTGTGTPELTKAVHREVAYTGTGTPELSRVVHVYGSEMLIRFEVTPTYKKGSILAVKPLGWQWGTEELSDRFIRVTVTDAYAYELEQYVGAYEIPVNVGTAEETKEVVNKRLYYMDSTAVDNVAAQPGRLLVTNKASVDNVMRNIIDHG